MKCDEKLGISMTIEQMNQNKKHSVAPINHIDKIAVSTCIQLLNFCSSQTKHPLSLSILDPITD